MGKKRCKDCAYFCGNWCAIQCDVRSKKDVCDVVEMNNDVVYHIIYNATNITDEYRTLIKTCTKLMKKLSEFRAEFWSLERNRVKLEAQVEKANIMKEFINSSDDIRTKYKLFLIERGEKSNEN